MIDKRVVVVGAGPGGLATAAELGRRGVPAVVLEQADAVGSSWRRRYDRLRLNSSRPFSKLPRGRFARGTPIFPSAAEMVRYLERYADRHRLDVHLGTRVERVDRDARGWIVRTADGDVQTDQVVIATGHERSPFIPDWPGRGEFGGQLLHSDEYRNPRPYREADVLVVGPGCSGMEIAYDLATGGAGRVRLAVRTPPNILVRNPAGVAIARTVAKLGSKRADAIARKVRLKELGDLSQYGLPVPDEGVFSRLERLGVAPSIVDVAWIEAIKDGRVEVVAGVEAFDRSGVALADGARLEPDAVIAATGYRCALEPMLGHLGVLGEDGVPHRGERERGLRFIGFVHRPGQLNYMGSEAKRAARAIARERRRAAAGRRVALGEPSAAEASG